MVGQNNLNSDINMNFSYRQKVIDWIYELIKTNNSNNLFLPEILINNNNGPEFFKAAILFFGTWENTLRKAGFADNSVTKARPIYNEFWSDESIIEQIRTLHEHNFDLSAQFIKNVYPELYNAAKSKQAFGGWYNALFEANINANYITSYSHRFWKLQQIFDIIYEYDLAYGNIQPEFIRVINPSLYVNAHRYFKTWSEAVSATGLNLKRNQLKVLLEPLKTYIFMDFVKQIFELLGLEHRVVQVPPIYDNELNSNITSQMIYEIQKQIEISNFYIEVDNGKLTKCITSAYRSWGNKADKLIYKLLEKYDRITCYYCIGEPRYWMDEKVEFINIEEYYPDLIKRGREDIISDLSLQTRGGIPQRFMEQYEKLMGTIRKFQKEQEKGKNRNNKETSGKTPKKT